MQVDVERKGRACFSSLLLSSLELSVTQVYESYIRALLRAASHFCEVVVLKLRTVPIGTALSLRILRVIRRGAQAIRKRGVAVIPLGGDVGGSQAKLSTSNNKTTTSNKKTTVQILHKQCSTPMAK